MTRDDLLRIELPSLRDELLEVKNCQHRVLVFALISTGAIIGFISPFLYTILEKYSFWPVLSLLLPMIIVIPSQYLILDKAITINRICSYIKVVEDYIAFQRGYVIPWEEGCAEFRLLDNMLKPAGGQNPTQGPNRYYKLTFIIVRAIAIVLVILMAIFYFSPPNKIESLAEQLVILALPIMVILWFLYDLYKWLLMVLEGKYTILAMANLWSDIFKQYNNGISTVPPGAHKE